MRSIFPLHSILYGVGNLSSFHLVKDVRLMLLLRNVLFSCSFSRSHSLNISVRLDEQSGRCAMSVLPTSLKNSSIVEGTKVEDTKLPTYLQEHSGPWTELRRPFRNCDVRGCTWLHVAFWIYSFLERPTASWSSRVNMWPINFELTAVLFQITTVKRMSFIASFVWSKIILHVCDLKLLICYSWRSPSRRSFVTWTSGFSFWTFVSVMLCLSFWINFAFPHEPVPTGFPARKEEQGLSPLRVITVSSWWTWRGWGNAVERTTPHAWTVQRQTVSAKEGARGHQLLDRPGRLIWWWTMLEKHISRLVGQWVGVGPPSVTLSEGSEMDCNMSMVGFWDGSGQYWSNGRKVNLQAHLGTHAGSRQAQGAPQVHTRSFSSSCANLRDSSAPVWAQGKRRLKQRNDGPTSCVKTALERIYLLFLRPSLVSARNVKCWSASIGGILTLQVAWLPAKWGIWRALWSVAGWHELRVDQEAKHARPAMLTIHSNMAMHVKICHRIIVCLRLIGPRPTVAQKGECADSKKVLLPSSSGPVLMENGGLILRNVLAPCATFKTSCRTGKL